MRAFLAAGLSLLFVFAALGGLVSATSGTGQAASAPSSIFRGFEVAGGAEDFQPLFRPLGLDGDRPVKVMVKLEGDPVAVVQSRMPDLRLSPEERAAIKEELRARQDAVKPYIEALGGRVLAQYQVVYNGLKVSIPRARLPALAGIAQAVEITPVTAYAMEHTNSMPLIGAPGVWGGTPGFRGEGIKVAIIDTGIDYTHANFGGPGTVEAFEEAFAASTQPADPSLFGPDAPKVKGGIDLVGDAYDASSDNPAQNVPHPDPNPLDCNGHGSHVAGTAAGFGVTTAGATYRGPYDTTTFSQSFEIGPGVAPLADLYAIRVFGCAGSTDVVVDALEWAVDHDVDIINMSLGAPFGLPGGADAEATNNAAAAGVVVVASAGNSGASPYITGSPASADRAISVAASDPIASLPGASAALSTGQTITVQNSNGAAFDEGLTLGVKVLRTASGGVSLGCDPQEYVNAGVQGKVAVVLRGVCARVAKAIYGQKAGAAAVAMINTDTGYPPFEDKITMNPDTGERYTVTIPFLGVRGVLSSPTSDGSKLVAADGGTVTLTHAIIANPGFKALAGFTSGGPRSGDSALKPEITAPGVSIRSTAVGTGNEGTRLSGTSMAAPHVAGVAALVRQAHPRWKVGEIKAAIVNTGSPSDVAGYALRRAGAGLIQAGPATSTSVVAFGDRELVSLSFGFRELREDFTGEAELHIRNRGSATATFTLAAAGTPGSSPHTLEFSRTKVKVRPGETEEVDVTLRVPAGTVGDSGAFREVGGLITLSPVGDSNGGIALRVPYYLVPRALSAVRAKLPEAFGPANPTATIALSNGEGAIAGGADFYAWGLKDRNEHLGEHDLRAVGVQSFAFPSGSDPNRRLIVFAVNTHGRWSNAAVNEFDVLLDVNGDGTDDFAVVGVDFGAVTAGSFNGVMGSFVVNLRTNRASIAFLAVAPTDSSTIELPFLSSQVGLSPANPRFTYHAESYDLRGVTPPDVMPGVARFNAYSPAISNAGTFAFVVVPPGKRATVNATIDATEWAQTPALGFMVVVLDNRAGPSEARLLPLSSGEEDGE